MVSDFGRGQSEKEQISSQLKVFKGVKKQEREEWFEIRGRL